MVTKTYIEFLLPGIFVPETQTKQVETRDVPTELPDNAYGYRFYDIAEEYIDGIRLASHRSNISGVHYVNCRKMTLEEVQAELPSKTILIENMQINGYKEIVYIAKGLAFPFYPEDMVE